MSEFSIVILLVVYIPIIAIMYFLGRIYSKPKENHILCSTIPLSKMDSNEIKDVVKQYLKANNYFLLFMIITAIPGFLLRINDTTCLSYMFIWIFAVIIAQSIFTKKYFNRIQTLKKENEWIVPDDKDKYWGVFFYNNPNDDRFLVENNSGYGTTINMAKKSAKIFMIIISIIIVISLGTSILSLNYFNNAKINMNITNNQISIDAPLYDYDFNIKDI